MVQRIALNRCCVRRTHSGHLTLGVRFGALTTHASMKPAGHSGTRLWDGDAKGKLCLAFPAEAGSVRTTYEAAALSSLRTYLHVC